MVMLIPDAISLRSAADPRSVAVVGKGASLTYRELAGRANGIASAIRESGAGSDPLVAVLMDRVADVVPVILGVWRRGGAYLPLDPQIPIERLRFLLADAAASLIVSQQSMKTVIDSLDCRLPVVYVED